MQLNFGKCIKMYFYKKTSSWPRASFDLIGVEKGEVIPDSATPKIYFLFLSRTTIQMLGANSGTKLYRHEKRKLIDGFRHWLLDWSLPKK